LSFYHTQALYGETGVNITYLSESIPLSFQLEDLQVYMIYKMLVYY